MFVQRAVVTFALLPIAIFVIYKGGWYYFVPIVVIMMIAGVEYSRLMGRLGWRLPIWILLPSMLLQLVAGQWPDLNLFGPAMLFSLLVAMGYALWRYEQNPGEIVTADWVAMMAGIFLLGWIGGHFFRLRGLPEMGWQWAMLAMLGTWMADSAAYIVGRFLAGTVFGRHRLSPRLSPNKTVEGYLGGIAFGTSFTIILASFLEFPLVTALLLGLLVSAVSPAGDLGISLLKREAGVKDSGALFLGHGGALDRTDSLLWSVALAYYLAIYVS